MKKLYLLIALILFTSISFFNYNPQEVVASDYYSSVDFNGSTAEVKADLKSLITRTHNYRGYGSSYNAVLARGAATSPGANTLELFYTGYIDTASNAGGGNQNDWNKEHVWPKSQTGGPGSAPANDIHNIRPTNTKINSTRSNLPFGEDFGGKVAEAAVPYAPGSTFCYYGNGKFEPRDEVKGDCARIIFYLLTRYDNLNVSTVGSMDLFFKWHYGDPVDQYEINMNNEIANFQGNRNPYIDHPNLVGKVFPNDYGMTFEELDTISLPSETSTNLSLPSKAGDYNITWTSSNTNVITNNGVVTRQLEDTNVTMKATITKEGKTGSKDFVVKVLHREYTTAEHMLYANMQNSLEIEFTSNGESPQTTTANTGVIDNTEQFLNFVSGTNYADTFGLDEDIFVLEQHLKGGTKAPCFYKNETMTLNENNIVKLSSNAGNIKSVKVTYSGDCNGTKLSSSPSGGEQLHNNVAVNIDSNEVYLIQGNSQARITAMEITYENSLTSYNVNNIVFNFGFEFDKATYDSIENSSDFDFGILYTEGSSLSNDIGSYYISGSITNFIESNNLEKANITKTVSGNNYLFSANLYNDDINYSVKACAYMVYDGKVYFSKSLKRSTKDVINIYLESYSTDPQVSSYVDLLKYILRNQ